MIGILLSVRRFLARESAHATVEYLFMLSLILVAVILGVKLVGTTTLDLFTKTRDALP
jgi:Flp pilus assembly pilin Flp